MRLCAVLASQRTQERVDDCQWLSLSRSRNVCPLYSVISVIKSLEIQRQLVEDTCMDSGHCRSDSMWRFNNENRLVYFFTKLWDRALETVTPILDYGSSCLWIRDNLNSFFFIFLNCELGHFEHFWPVQIKKKIISIHYSSLLIWSSCFDGVYNLCFCVGLHAILYGNEIKTPKITSDVSVRQCGYRHCRCVVHHSSNMTYKTVLTHHGWRIPIAKCYIIWTDGRTELVVIISPPSLPAGREKSR